MEKFNRDNRDNSEIRHDPKKTLVFEVDANIFEDLEEFDEVDKESMLAWKKEMEDFHAQMEIKKKTAADALAKARTTNASKRRKRNDGAAVQIEATVVMGASHASASSTEADPTAKLDATEAESQAEKAEQKKDLIDSRMRKFREQMETSKDAESEKNQAGATLVRGIAVESGAPSSQAVESTAEG